MIFVTGGTCEACGTPLQIEGPNATGDAYIERDNGDQIVTLCKNSPLCIERQDQQDRKMITWI